MDLIKEQEKIIEQYLNEGNQEAAVKVLFDLIVDCAKKKDFIKAEAFRDKLFDVAPMALNEIAKSGDIIDEEKSRAIDDVHREKWAGLYSTLTPEETNALYFALKERFYEEGKVKMIFLNNDEGAVKMMEQGDTAGKDTFFYSTAYRTFSLKAESKAKLYSLDREVLGKWKDDFPGLEKKLIDYCLKSGEVSEYLRTKGIDRRGVKRKKISGKVAVRLLDHSGVPTGKQFTGALCDISMSGLSFTFKLSNNEVARKLLGTKIKTQLVIPVGESSEVIEQIGKIVGIGYNVLADHSLHVRFDKIDEAIKKLIGE